MTLKKQLANLVISFFIAITACSDGVGTNDSSFKAIPNPDGNPAKQCEDGKVLNLNNECIFFDQIVDPICPDGQIFVNFTCVPSCKMDADCSADQVCSTKGACVTKVGNLPCNNSTQCGNNNECINHECQAVVPTTTKPGTTCVTGDTCSEGFSCTDGSCKIIPGTKLENDKYCANDTDCKSNYCLIKKTIQVGDIGDKKTGYYVDPYGICAAVEKKYEAWDTGISFVAAIQAAANICTGKSFNPADESQKACSADNIPADKKTECIKLFNDKWTETINNKDLCPDNFYTPASVGGKGGAQKTFQCPANNGVTAMRAFAKSNLNAIQIGCTPFSDIVKSQPSGATWIESLAGKTTGDEIISQVPPQTVYIGFVAKKCTDTVNSGIICEFTPYYKSLVYSKDAYTTNNPSIVGSHPILKGPDLPIGPEAAYCKDGDIMVGLTVRSGDNVDQLAPLCQDMTPPQTYNQVVNAQ